MHEQLISKLFLDCSLPAPQSLRHCSIGQGNYVYIADCSTEKYIVRLATEHGAYKDTVHWLSELGAMNLPVPRVIHNVICENYDFLILTYLEGKDIGLVYPSLSPEEKQDIAREIVRIQNQVALLPLKGIADDWNWSAFIYGLLERAETRILRNGHFSTEKVKQLLGQMPVLQEYFNLIPPVAYLDDISSKNLLIHNGRISGIIDVDWIGVGDKLTFAALTYMALLDLEYDTDYVFCILKEMHLNKTEECAFLFYTLVYCVDFMGERGMQFMDKTIEVSPQIVAKLNRIYDTLWQKWRIKSSRLANSAQE